MTLDWSTIVQYTISGAIVSWPVFIAGLWFSHRNTQQHVDQVTEQQTHDVRKITDTQTATLLDRLGGAYQQHDSGEEGHEDQGEGEAAAEGGGQEGRGPEAGV